MKIVLAYSGGLDTSVIVKWLKETYQADIITFAADIGQEEELKGLPQKARRTGASKHFTLDLVEEFASDFIYPMIRANAIYEGQYYLGTSIARPLIAKAQVEIAKREKADTVAHGATGKGNDQCRFELTYMALAPELEIIAPWKLENFRAEFPGRAEMIAYCQQHQIPVEASLKKPYSMDRNLLHISYEAGILEDPWFDPTTKANKDMFKLSVSPEDAPDRAEYVELDFEKGDCVAVNGRKLSPGGVLKALNRLGGKHGIGRVDLVENRFVGMKSRGIYETPGGTILLEAHRGIEQITLDSGAGHLKDALMPRYAELIYNGFWFSPEREMLQAAINRSQEHVTGTVRVKLYKGSARTVARWSDRSLYSEAHVTFEDDAGAYDQKDAAGFIRLNALRLKLIAARNRRLGG
jgi:argininosuccinate synthase